VRQDVLEDLQPNGPEKRIRARVRYANDNDHFVIDTDEAAAHWSRAGRDASFNYRSRRIGSMTRNVEPWPTRLSTRICPLASAVHFKPCPLRFLEILVDAAVRVLFGERQQIFPVDVVRTFRIVERDLGRFSPFVLGIV
jgi:hypothetical protein